MPDDRGSPRVVLGLLAIGLVVYGGVRALVLVGVIAIGAGVIVVSAGLVVGVAIELGMWGWWHRDSAATPRQRPDASGHDRTD